MKRSLETIGLSVEISGLATLLIAAVWQATVTDWLDQFPVRSQYYIQETANLAILRSIDQLAFAMEETNPIRRKEQLAKAHEISNSTISKLIEIRDGTESVEKNNLIGLSSFVTHFLLSVP